VHEPEKSAAQKSKPRVALNMETARALGQPFWLVMVIASAVLIARISDAFLVLRGSDLGLALVFIPLVLVVLNGVDTLSSYPAGWLSDRVARKTLLGVSLVALAISLAILAYTSSTFWLWIALGFFGLHMAFSQSILSSFVANAAPPALRGSAFGMFGFVSGIASFAGSLAAGLAWDRFGAQDVFFGAAILAVFAAGFIATIGQVQATSSHQ